MVGQALRFAFYALHSLYMQKKPLVIGCVVAILVLILGLGGLLGGGMYFVKKMIADQGQTAEVPVAVLRVERGSATVVSGSASQEVTTETQVGTGDEITVSSDGRAALYWDGHGRTLIDAGTKLRVEEASRPAGPDSIKAKILIDIGRTWTRIEQVLDVGSEVSAATNDVVATVRGTSFGVDRTGGTSAIRVKESKVAASRPGSVDMVEVDAGFKYVGGQSTRLSETELADPFVVDGDRDIPDEDYDLSSFLTGAEAWLQKGLEYLMWRPWLLSRIDFGAGGDTFREWYGNFPADIRAGIEAKNGAPNYDEISRLLDW